MATRHLASRFFPVMAVVTFVVSHLFADYPGWNNYTCGKQVKAIAIKHNDVWVGTTAGLAKISKVTGRTVFYNKANSGLPDNDVHSVMLDSGGRAWIGTGHGGAALFDGTRWTIYNQSNSGLPRDSVSCIAQDSAGVMWIGTRCGGLARFDGTNWSVYNRFNSGLEDPNSHVVFLTVDDSANKWICTEESGVLQFHDTTTWIDYLLPMLPGVCNVIALDRSHRKWVGGDGGGLVVIDGDARSAFNTSNSLLP